MPWQYSVGECIASATLQWKESAWLRLQLAGVDLHLSLRSMGAGIVPRSRSGVGSRVTDALFECLRSKHGECMHSATVAIVYHTKCLCLRARRCSWCRLGCELRAGQPT